MDGEPRFGELFEHQAWVRALASRLCAPHAADDLIQETWVEALRSGHGARSTRAWLGGVVRHLWRRSQRSEMARVQRELGAMGERQAPSPELLLARAELQRRVLAAVAGLDEPHRVVVLMHYYEGCSSATIAKRLGCPSSTVRNRLVRAHRRLRTELDREWEGGAAWSALFAPGLAWESAKLGGLVMKAKLAVAAGVAVVLAGAAWLVIDRASSPVRSPEEHASPAALLAATVQPETPPEGAAPAITERTDAPKASVESVLVWGELHGGAGLQDGMIELFDELERPYTAAVGANATWSIFGIAPGRYRIRTRFAGYVPLDEELVLGSELERVRHDLTLVRSAVIPVRFVSRADGKDLDRHALGARSLSVIATLEKPGAHIPGVVDYVVMSFGAGQFHSAIDGDMVPEGAHGSLEVIAPLPVWASCVLRSEVLESRWIRGGESELVFELDPAEIESRLGALVVECVDGRTGERLEEARVHTSFRSGGGRNDSRRGADGRLTLTRLAPGMQMLELGADDFAAYQSWIRILPGETLDLGTIALFPTARLDGRVSDPEGKGVAATIAAIPHRRISVRCLDLQRRWSSNANGVFERMEVERGMARLIALSPDWALAAVDVDTARDEPVEIRLEHGTDVALRVAPGGPPSVDVSLLDSGGQPLWFGRIVMTRLKLKPGRYELCTVVDENIVERRSLDVGDRPLVVEVGGSR